MASSTKFTGILPGILKFNLKNTTEHPIIDLRSQFKRSGKYANPGKVANT